MKRFKCPTIIEGCGQSRVSREMSLGQSTYSCSDRGSERDQLGSIGFGVSRELRIAFLAPAIRLPT